MSASPAVVVYVNGSAPDADHSAPKAGDFVGKMFAAGRRLDPYGINATFPEKWRAYLHAAFRNHFEVAQAFQVSERTARKWWAGEGGAQGGKVAIAVSLHPGVAPRMLFAAE
ncbi:hypothetical protein [uncultured Maritimibacter sp.]|jgi:hypothetical protein|uniref:hypothetical protein n=1 Tax=uncultured Maritimibacter sp. TaxID=991866 RepID=UPI002626662E|nr:hypothetical protein [uncultured Maritimibacter sp.]